MKQTFTHICQAMLGFFLCLYLAVPAAAQTPTYSYNPTSYSTNVFPLSSTTSNFVQWLYTPAEFTPAVPTSGILLTTLYIKAGSTSATGGTFTNLVIKMNTNSTLTTLTSGPWNTGLTTVYNVASATIGSWTTNGWVPITLPTPIFYNGTSNILLEISQSGYTVGMSVQQGSISGSLRRMYGSATSSTSSGADASELLFGFDAIPADCSGQPQAPSIATPAFNAAAPLCTGSTTSITGVNPNLGNGLSVFWETSSSATGPWSAVTGGSGATTLTYTTPAITANTYFRMGVNCSFSNLKAYSPAFLVPVGAPQPGVISGSTTFCPGDAGTYSITASPGTTYTWTVPTGWTSVLTSPPATNSIQVTPGTTAGTVSVTASSSCGTSIAQTRPVTAGSAPLAPLPASVTGNRYICDNTPQTYTVTPVNGTTSYIWTLPSGWTATASTTNTISVTNASGAGNISVRAVNGCGQSSATVIPISVISSLANPGTITGKDTLCSGALQTYSINPVNGATSYVWTLPPGWSGTTSGTSVQVFGGTGNGPISVTAYVSCATSPASSRNLTAVATVTPTVTLSSPGGTLCELQKLTFTATGTGGGTNPVFTWRRNGSVVTGTANTYQTASLKNGDVISVTMNSNASCASTPTVTAAPLTVNIIPAVVPGISINTLPTTTICRGTSLALNATATGGGPNPKYQWFKNGAAIASANGLNYVATGLNDNDTLSVTLTSDATCATATLANSNTVVVNVADALTPKVDISVSPSEILVAGQPVTFTATPTNGGATPAYQWIVNGDDVAFETNPTFTSSKLAPNDHVTVRMLSYLSCASPKTAKSSPIVMRADPLRVGTTPDENGLRLYPNPSSGMLSLRGSVAVRGGLRLDVFNTVGQLVHHVLLPGGAATANWNQDLELPAGLAEGNYLLRVSTGTNDQHETIATLPFMLHR